MSDSSHGRFRLLPARWTLVPRFPEPIEPEFYRFTGKIRTVLVAVIVVLNLLGGLTGADMGYDVRFYWRQQIPINSLAVADIVLAVWLWRGRVSLRGMWRLAVAGMILEITTMLIATWAFGSTSSHFVLFGVIAVMTYRVVYDFAAGAIGALYWLVGHWAIVVCEVLGWLPHQPVFGGHVEVHAQRHLSEAIIISLVTVVAFLMGNWTVARLRHKELAVRILRQTLAARGDGEVGRHTGTTLRGTYEVGTLLGSGGMGEVYRGRHLRTGREVAIKVLHPHLVDDETLMKRFRREAEVTGRLGSRNIVEIVDVDRDGELPFLVLELLDGEDLAARIARDGALPLDEVADIVEQVTSGLEVAHGAAIVHRDLKPENLFLCRDGAVKILDFGVSKIRGNATAITHEIALIGTPDYMSPEQATAVVDEVDGRADIFALGGITYAMLTGTRPFSAASVPALLRRICDEEPVAIEELRPEVPAPVIDAIAIAMAKLPEERYQRVEQFRADLAAAFAGTLAPAVSQRALGLTRGRPPASTPAGERVSATAPTTVDGSTPR